MTISFLFLALLGFVPSIIWLLFYLHEDLHPEPKHLIAVVFLFGMLSAFVALGTEQLLNGAMSANIIKLAAPLSFFQLLYLIALASIEEIVKFGAAYLGVRNDREFNEPVDAMIYMATAALGFATIENLGALTSVAAQGGILSNELGTITVRFVGATLLHSLASGFVGYYWGMGIREFGMHTWKHVLFGLTLAVMLHTIFNYLIISYGNLIYVLILLLISGFFLLNDFEERGQEFV